jgi:hypothetical protein
LFATTVKGRIKKNYFELQNKEKTRVAEENNLSDDSAYYFDNHTLSTKEKSEE